MMRTTGFFGRFGVLAQKDTLDDVDLIDDALITEAKLATAVQTLLNSQQRRNLLINGDFQIWQRGTTIDGASTYPNNDGGYCADRWMCISDTDDHFDITRQDADSGCLSRYFMRLTAVNTTAAPNAEKGGICQIIDGVTTRAAVLATKVSLSFRAKINSGGPDLIRYGILEWDGTEDTITAGSPVSAWNTDGSAPVLIANWNHTSVSSSTSAPTTSWATYTKTGVTLQSDTKNLAVFIIVEDKDYSAADYLDIADVQLEINTTNTEFDRRPFHDELAACQRYFAKTFPYGTEPNDNAGRSGAVEAQADFASDLFAAFILPTTMRAAPTVTQYNPDATTAGRAERQDSTAPLLLVSSTRNSDRQAVMENLTAAASNVGYVVHFTADAEFAI